MEKLAIPPDYTGYSVADSTALLFQSSDGGLSRARRDLLDGTRFVAVQWTVVQSKVNYLRDFHRAYIGRNAESFLIDLYSNSSTLVEYKAQFVANTFKLASQNGLDFVFTATLEIEPADNESENWPQASTTLFLHHFDKNFKEEIHPSSTYTPIIDAGTVQLSAANAIIGTKALDFNNGFYYLGGRLVGSVIPNFSLGRLCTTGKLQISVFFKPRDLASYGGGFILTVSSLGDGINGSGSTSGVGGKYSQLQMRLSPGGSGGTGIQTVWGVEPEVGVGIAAQCSEAIGIPVTLEDDEEYFYAICIDGIDSCEYSGKVSDGVALKRSRTVTGSVAKEYKLSTQIYTDQRVYYGAGYAGGGDPGVFTAAYTGAIDEVRFLNGREYYGDSIPIPTEPFKLERRKLTLPPDQTSYGIDLGDGVLSVQNEGSAGRYSRSLFNNSLLVSALWICDENEYDYLAQCDRAATALGGPIFDIDLLLDETDKLTTYKARFIPGTFKLTSVAGETYNVTAQLEIEPLPYDVSVNPFVVDAGLSDRRLKGSAGYYAIGGQDVILRGPYRLNARPGYYYTDGQPIVLFHYSYLLVVANGVYALTGESVGLVRIPYLMALQGGYVIAGQSAIVARDLNFDPAQGTYALTGEPAGLQYSRELTANQGAYTLTGRSVALRRANAPITATRGIYAIFGPTVNLTYSSLCPNYATATLKETSDTYTLPLSGATGIVKELNCTYTPPAST